MLHTNQLFNEQNYQPIHHHHLEIHFHIIITSLHSWTSSKVAITCGTADEDMAKAGSVPFLNMQQLPEDISEPMHAAGLLVILLDHKSIPVCIRGILYS